MGTALAMHLSASLSGIVRMKLMVSLSKAPFRLHAAATQERVVIEDLPQSYADLYAQGQKHGKTAVCLVCGELLVSHEQRRSGEHRIGALTAHAASYVACWAVMCWAVSFPIALNTFFSYRCGSGSGMFFLMRDCGVLLVRHASSAYGPSLYVDDYGECRLAGAGRPLFLDPERANALMTLWLENG